jgi:heptosyltransferase-2
VRNILVIRFGSLGDLCLLGWSLSAAADAGGPRGLRLTLATKAAFAPLMSEVRGLDRVAALDGGGLGAVSALAGRLRGEDWDLVLDAHNILRSHLLLGMLRHRPDARLAKDTAARLRLLADRRRGGAAPSPPALRRTMAERFDAVLAAAAGPLDGPCAPPLAHLAGGRGPEAPVGLAPGAQWDAKRWPEASFADVARTLRAGGRRVRVFLGPREDAWFDAGPLAAAARDDDGIEVVRGRGLVEVARLLGECRGLVTNDSGLLHLAEAVGTPVAAFFGPTVREFGYFPRLPRSRALQVDLDCRPCSRNGKRPCHRGDLACLTRIAPDAALDAVAAWEDSR